MLDHIQATPKGAGALKPPNNVHRECTITVHDHPTREGRFGFKVFFDGKLIITSPKSFTSRRALYRHAQGLIEQVFSMELFDRVTIEKNTETEPVAIPQLVLVEGGLSEPLALPQREEISALRKAA